MKIAKQNGYVSVSEFGSLSDIASADLDGASVAVFSPDTLTGTADAETAEKMKNIPAVTILAMEDMTGIPMDVLMLFDIRLGMKPYALDGSEKSSVMDIRERYKVLCGERADYLLDCYLNSGSSEPFESALVRILGGEKPFADEVDEYMEVNLRGKSEFQIASIAKCLVKARSGVSSEVLNAESVEFFRLIKKKGEECADGNE